MLGDFVRYRVSRQFCRQITRQQLPTLPMPLCPHRPTLAFYTYYPYSFLVYLIALIHLFEVKRTAYHMVETPSLAKPVCWVSRALGNSFLSFFITVMNNMQWMLLI